MRQTVRACCDLTSIKSSPLLFRVDPADPTGLPAPGSPLVHPPEGKPPEPAGALCFHPPGAPDRTSPTNGKHARAPAKPRRLLPPRRERPLRSTGAMAFDGKRLSAGTGRRDPFGTCAIVSPSRGGRPRSREHDRRLVQARPIPVAGEAAQEHDRACNASASTPTKASTSSPDSTSLDLAQTNGLVGFGYQRRPRSSDRAHRSRRQRCARVVASGWRGSRLTSGVGASAAGWRAAWASHDQLEPLVRRRARSGVTYPATKVRRAVGSCPEVGRSVDRSVGKRELWR
jgi:hypothetical protein